MFKEPFTTILGLVVGETGIGCPRPSKVKDIAQSRRTLRQQRRQQEPGSTLVFAQLLDALAFTGSHSILQEAYILITSTLALS